MEIGVIVVIVVTLLVIVGLIFILLRNKGYDFMREDYRTYFIVGISFIPIGIATDNMAFTALGIIFMIIGLTNRNKWQENKI